MSSPQRRSGRVTVRSMHTGEVLRYENEERVPVPQALKNAVWARDGLCCRYCGYQHKDASKYEIDHVLPVSKGGKNSMGNLVVACRRCNRRKSNELGWRPLPAKEAKRIRHWADARHRRTGWKWRYLPHRKCLPEGWKP